MAKAVAFRSAIAALLICAASSSAQFTRRINPANFAVTVRPTESVNASAAKALENQVSQLPPSHTLEVKPPTGANAMPAPVNHQNGAPAAPVDKSGLGTAKVEFVPANPVIDTQVARAIAGQSSVRQLIGNNGTVLALPGIVRQIDQSGDELQLKMFALAGKRLAYDAKQNTFVGSIWLGVNEIVGGRPPRTLMTPVDFEILDADTAEPAEIHVARTGAPYQQVQLHVAAAEDAKVNIASSLAPDPFALPLPLNPTLLIRASDDPIEGLGLGTSIVSVTAIGLANPKGRPVIFQKLGAGSINPRQTFLDEKGMASTELRSDWLGGAQVAATLPGLAQASIGVDFRPPYGTMLAAFLGALVGAAIRVGSSQLRGSEAARAIGVSVLVGILVFALYAIGVNVLPIKPTVTQGAVLVFAISALGAFVGVSVLPGQVPSPAPSPKPAPPPDSDATPPAGG